MVGDRSENIAMIMQTMALDPATQEVVEKVMHIFYDKIDRLRKERNHFKAENRQLRAKSQ